MKGKSRIVFCLLLLCALGLVLKLSLAKNKATDENLFVLHQDLSKIKTNDCVSCHDVYNEKSLDRNIRTAHVIHSFFGVEGCITCHQDFDLTQDSGHTLRKQVDMKICSECHGTGSGGWKLTLLPVKQQELQELKN